MRQFLKPLIAHRSSLIARCGLTLIEIMVALSVLVVILAAGLTISVGQYRREQITAERDVLATLLRRARSDALANTNQADHGLAVTTSSYVVYQGSSYAGRTADYDQPFARTSGLVLGGPAEVTFRALDAAVLATGTLTISNNTRTLSVSVNEEGRIEW
ncbi:MAG: type II secretion system protein [Candidatus Liptonbacteria bacterium]|nr:type II secretion system protein [Candidatus Liptonbacteria bacterium]